MAKESQYTLCLRDIDVNSPNFYNNFQEEIELDLANVKKNVKLITNLRLTAAEMEVETAILYHAELWYDIEDLKLMTEETRPIDLPENV